jgi:hypothetical protein
MLDGYAITASRAQLDKNPAAFVDPAPRPVHVSQANVHMIDGGTETPQCKVEVPVNVFTELRAYIHAVTGNR